ncbi:hypothetical protein [Citrobacter portucalensis]|uniref:hypothetical protein n=1 Tax=Citrobacter portucalensis TaxID=1639133 RepID=UPI002551A30D|nr:hypothetical protein [Citrobacter portucalensis]
MKKLIIAACVALSGCSAIGNTFLSPVTATEAENLSDLNIVDCSNGESFNGSDGNFYAADVSVCKAELNRRTEAYRKKQKEIAADKAAKEAAAAETKKERIAEEKREAPLRAAEHAKMLKVCGFFANDMRIKYRFGNVLQIQGNQAYGDTWMCNIYFADLVTPAEHFAMLQVNPANGAYNIMAVN